MPAATRHGRRADRPPPPELGDHHPRQARSPRRPGARSARASAPCTGEGVVRLAPGLSERVAGGRADPLQPEHLGGSKRRTARRAGRRSHYWSSPLPLPIPSLPFGGGKGRTRKKKKKKEKGGGVGELDIKIGLGGMVEDFWSPQQRLFLRRRRRRQRQQEKERQP